MTPAPAYAVGVMEIWTSAEIPNPYLPDAAKSALSSLSAIGNFDEKPTPTQDPGPINPTDDPEPRPTPIGYLRIAFSETNPTESIGPRRWSFWSVRAGNPPDICESDMDRVADGSLKFDDPGYPPNDYSVDLVGISASCEYRGSKDSPGTLSCSGWDSDVKCIVDSADVSVCVDSDSIFLNWRVICHYSSSGPSSGSSRQAQVFKNEDPLPAPVLYPGPKDPKDWADLISSAQVPHVRY